MKKALVQMAVAIGGMVFVLVMAIALVREVPFFSALFRAIVAMSVSAIAMGLFFRFFTAVLYRFVAEQVLKHANKREPRNRTAAHAGELPNGPGK